MEEQTDHDTRIMIIYILLMIVSFILGMVYYHAITTIN